MRFSLADIRRKIGNILLKSGKPGRLRTSLHYLAFSKAYGREQEAFLAGIRRYGENTADPSDGAALLRRNIHRLEKGLLMRPRRVPFAKEYIEETVGCYERACSKRAESATEMDEGELKWATDVLVEYFDVMRGRTEMDVLRARLRVARCSLSLNGTGSERYIPYRRDLSQSPSVAYEALLQLAWRRRSVRWFLDRSVPRDLIDKAVTVAGLSPSACNRQPFIFRIVDDPPLVQRVVEIPFGLSGYGHNVPVIAIVVGQQRNYFDERDRHLIYIDGSLAAMSFIYALESLGLASCCVNWPDLADREAKMMQLLGLEQDERPVMLVAIGYPDPEGMVAYSKKKPLSQLRKYNLDGK